MIRSPTRPAVPESPMQDLNQNLAQLSHAARSAAQKRDWATVNAAAQEFIRQQENHAEGYFLLGLSQKGAQQQLEAKASFEQALQLDGNRHDAAIELADLLVMGRLNGDAKFLVEQFQDRLTNSPRYLDMAGTVMTYCGLQEKAWPLYKRANELQPDIELFQANLAACAVFLGKIDEARQIYDALLAKKPWHQRNHYQLSRLVTATDSTHIEQMKKILFSDNMPPEQNIYLYYAIGKEYEDLGDWKRAFKYYKLGGDAVASVANYSFESDKALIDAAITHCNAEWLANDRATGVTDVAGKTPIFVLGLPRTGTTLAERIISSHSTVHSIGETEFLEFTIRNVSGVFTQEKTNAEVLEAASRADINLIANGYLNGVAYALGEEQFFIEKMPYNFLYIGFIAKAFPDAKIVHLNRHPLDATFAMYKQVFTWAFKFSYTLEDLGSFYIAYSRLMEHWRELLGDRLVELQYETLVSDQEQQTRQLLDNIGLPFEQACLDFQKNKRASATASSVQIREKIHTRSINKWQQFEEQLAPLREQLEQAGIDLSPR